MIKKILIYLVVFIFWFQSFAFACDVTYSSLLALDNGIAAFDCTETDSGHYYICLQDGNYGASDAGVPIIINSCPGDGPENKYILKPETPGGVTFSGEQSDKLFRIDVDHWQMQGFIFDSILETDTNNGTVIFVTGDYFRFTNNLVQNIGDNVNTGMDWFLWFDNNGINYGRYAKVDHNTFRYFQSKALVFKEGATHPHIHHNHFDTCLDGVGDSRSSIYMGADYSTPSMYAIVEYNLWTDWAGDSETIENKGSYNDYRYNVFRKVSGGCNILSLRGGDHNNIYGNFFLESNKYAIRIYGSDHNIVNNHFHLPEYGAINVYGPGDDDPTNYEHVERILIANNTILATSIYGILIGWPSSDVGERHVNLPTIINNIIQGAPGAGYALIADYGHTNGQYGTNILYDTGGNGREWHYDSSGYNAGIPEPAGFAHVNPNLTLSYGREGLQSSSLEAIEKATSITDPPYAFEVTVDVDGETRATGTPKSDIGADEFIEGTPIITIDSIVAGSGHNFSSEIRVSQAGAGSQDGSSCANAKSEAWLEAGGNVSPGDTVYLCGHWTWALGANEYGLRFPDSGTSGNLITIDGDDGSGNPFSFTDTQEDASGFSIDLNANYLRLTDVTNATTTYHSHAAVWVSGQNNIEIDEVDLRMKMNRGINIVNSTDVDIDDVYVADTDGNWSHLIRIEDGSQRISLTNSEIYDGGHAQIAIVQESAGTIQDITVAGNTLGIDLNSTQGYGRGFYIDETVAGAVVDNITLSGNRVIGARKSWGNLQGMSNLTMSGNIFENSRPCCCSASWDGCIAQDDECHNNWYDTPCTYDWDGTGHGFKIGAGNNGNPSDIKIINNDFIKAKEGGLSIAAPIANLTISGNEFNNMAWAALPTDSPIGSTATNSDYTLIFTYEINATNYPNLAITDNIIYSDRRYLGDELNDRGPDPDVQYTVEEMNAESWASGNTSELISSPASNFQIQSLKMIGGYIQ